MTTKDIIQASLNRVAETHFHERVIIEQWAKTHMISPDPAVRKIVGDYDTWYDIKKASFQDKFFDMGTLIRLAATIELSLKYYFREKKGFATNKELKDYLRSKETRVNVFQQIKRMDMGVFSLYKEVGYDLSTNKEIKSIQEIFVNRHLFVHNLGIVDDGYVNNLKVLSLYEEGMFGDYENTEAYYFKPLDKLGIYIESARSFFLEFPN